MEDEEVSWEEVAAEEVVLGLASAHTGVATLAMVGPIMALQGPILDMATPMQGITAFLGLMGLARGDISQQTTLEDPPQGR